MHKPASRWVAPKIDKEVILYKIFSLHANVNQVMERWTTLANDFDELVGHTHLGDVFLRNSKTGKFAVLFTISPELVPVDASSLSDFENNFLSHPEARRTILQPEKLAAIELRLGNLTNDEIYVPVPFPFMGGDRSVASYKKGNLFTYLEMVGELQNID